MEMHEIYTLNTEKRLSRRLGFCRLALFCLAVSLLLSLFLFVRQVDPIDPGNRQLYATLLLIFGGWVCLFILFHALLPARRDLHHVQRMMAGEGEEKTYRGSVHRPENATLIPGSIELYRLSLQKEEGEETALLWKKAATNFPRDATLQLMIRNGYIVAWQEADHG